MFVCIWWWFELDFTTVIVINKQRWQRVCVWVCMCAWLGSYCGANKRKMTRYLCRCAHDCMESYKQWNWNRTEQASKQTYIIYIEIVINNRTLCIFCNDNVQFWTLFQVCMSVFVVILIVFLAHERRWPLPLLISSCIVWQSQCSCSYTLHRFACFDVSLCDTIQNIHVITRYYLP